MNVISEKHKIIFSLGFAPILIAVYNIINTILGIDNRILMYLLPVVISIFCIVFSLRFINLRNFFSIEKSSIKLVTIGVIFGLAYWLILFYKYYKNGVLYPDVTFNLGIINELKVNFPPVDPHWYTGRILNYHFLTQIFIAGMSNFIGLDVLTAMHFTNILIAISLFVILSLYVESGVIEKLMVWLIFIFISFSNEWIPSSGIYAHITGATASTFYWSLPILITIIIVWQYINQYRFKIQLKYLILILILSTLILFYAKGPFVFAFVVFEFIGFITFLYSSFSKKKNYIDIFLKSIKYFIWCPAFTLLLIFFAKNASSGLTFGIEIRDFALFKTWNPFFPIFSIYAVLTSVILLQYRNLKKIRREYLFCSIFFFIMFLILKHPGYSDLDFLFVAVILNALLLISSGFHTVLRDLILSVFIVNLFVFLFNLKYDDRGLNTLNFNLDKISNMPIRGDSTSSKKMKELFAFSEKMPKHALIAVPKNANERFFCYSAFIGRRIWNENNLYSAQTNSIYTSIRLFQKQEGFIPYYIQKIPLIENRDYEFSKFVEINHYLDTLKVEIADNRWKLYNNCVFDSLSLNEYLNIVKDKMWTHILVENKNIENVNYWIRNLKFIRGDYYTIFICP